MSCDLEGGDVTVPEFIFLQCAYEVAVGGGGELCLQRLVSFIPDA